MSEAPALRIVDQDLWDTVKQRQARPAKLSAETASAERTDLAANRVLKRRRHLLSGLVRCGICGGPMTVAGGSARGGKRRYYCTNHKEKGESVCPGQPASRRISFSSVRSDTAFRSRSFSFSSSFSRFTWSDFRPPNSLRQR
ncbi:hypothetical protein D1122_19875 [Cereibacter sphaeroides]|nr:hypothetical protein D1122_19875 [Cereibacter sphaeroides]